MNPENNQAPRPQWDEAALIAQINGGDSIGFHTHNGYRATKLEVGRAEMEVTLTDATMNIHGAAHGGTFFGLCDEVTIFACATAELDPLAMASRSVTAGASINFLRAGRGTRLRAVAECVKQGRTLSVIDARVYDDEDSLLCTATFTYFHKQSN